MDKLEKSTRPYWPNSHRKIKQTNQNNFQLIQDFIKTFWQTNLCSPTIREIKAACKVSSTSVVAYRLEKMAEIGMIGINEGKARQFTIPGMRIVFDDVEVA